MKFQALFFLLLLSSMCLSLAQGSYGNCCLGYVRGMKKNAERNIISYRIQETDGDCNIRAVVFQMKRRGGQKKKSPPTVCANPDQTWVRDLMRAVNARATK